MSDGKIHVRCLRDCVRFFIVLIVLVPASAVLAQDKPALRWELVNPFRFISDQDSMDDLRRIYDGLNDKTARGLERELQKISNEAIDKKRATASGFDCDHTRSEGQLKQCFETYVGWFERLARNDHAKTCWDSDAKKFRNEGDCANYIYPKSHRVRVWVENTSLPGGAVPTWFIDGKPLSEYAAYKSCAAKYQKAACVEFPVVYDLEHPRTLNVTAQLSDGSPQLGPLPVKVVDKLIVGLGDSYASGEGNPDIPARFTLQDTDPDFLQKFLSGAPPDIVSIFKRTRAPRKDNYKGAEVSWLDERCHRSMYSYQFQTALLLALSNPREAITYVSYSCSGATTDQIINKEQKSKEGGGNLLPQLEALRRVLANKEGPQREIDYLLLSTGGNDVGFASFVAYVVAGDSSRWLVAFGIDQDEVKKGGVKIVQTLMGTSSKKGNYFKLQDELLNGANGIRIKDCGDKKPCAKRILLTPYPDIFSDENGNQCRGDRREFDIPFGASTDRATRIDQVRKNIFAPLSELQQKRVPAELGWTVVTDHLTKYSSHGFCARNAQSASKAAEKFEMPTCAPKDKCKKGEWMSFRPREYSAYETRQRWVRLPVDAKLTTDQIRLLGKRLGINFRLDWLLEDDRSNIMHPTSEGLSVTADANFEMIRTLERAINP